MSEANDCPLYEYEVMVRQVVETLQVIEASDAKSAREQAMQEFELDIPDHSELDVTSCEMMYSNGAEPTESERAREEDDEEEED